MVLEQAFEGILNSLYLIDMVVVIEWHCDASKMYICEPDDWVDAWQLVSQCDNCGSDLGGIKVYFLPGSCPEETVTTIDADAGVEFCVLNDETVHVHKTLVCEESAPVHSPFLHVPDQGRSSAFKLSLLKVHYEMVRPVDVTSRLNQKLQFLH